MSSASIDPKQAARAAAQERLAELLALLRPRAADAGVAAAIDAGEHLSRAIAAFHMEAIRFRVFTIERFVRNDPAADERVRRVLAELESSLETAGFQTSSKGL